MTEDGIPFKVSQQIPPVQRVGVQEIGGKSFQEEGESRLGTAVTNRDRRSARWLKVCAWCSKQFTSHRNHAVCCSASCRQAANRSLCKRWLTFKEQSGRTHFERFRAATMSNIIARVTKSGELKTL